MKEGKTNQKIQEKETQKEKTDTSEIEKKSFQEKEEKKEKKPESKDVSEKEEVTVPQKFKKLVEEIESLSVLDLAELVKILEKKFGVSAVPQVMTAMPAGMPAGAEKEAGPSPAGVEEKSVFTIELKAIGDKKIEVIKAVRDITGKGLKEAKDLVDAVSSGPQVIKENVKKEEAEELKKKLEAAGAQIELK